MTEFATLRPKTSATPCFVETKHLKISYFIENIKKHRNTALNLKTSANLLLPRFCQFKYTLRV